MRQEGTLCPSAKIGSKALELSASRATSAPEASLKLDAIAPSGNALHFDRLSAVSKVEPSVAAQPRLGEESLPAAVNGSLP